MKLYEYSVNNQQIKLNLAEISWNISVTQKSGSRIISINPIT